MSVQPYVRRIAVVDPPADQGSGIILPEGYDHIRKGIIVGIGPHVEELEVGDKVWYMQADALELKGDEKVIIIFAERVFAFSKEMDVD